MADGNKRLAGLKSQAALTDIESDLALAYHRHQKIG